jgi:hypothetical protein
MKSADEIRQAADGAKVIRLPPRRITSMTLEQLLAADLPEPGFLIPGLIQKGLTILAGRPKLGKSWLLLDIALAATTSRKALGAYEAEKGDVLLLSLEDNFIRLKNRFRTLGAKPSCQLDIHTEWPRGKDAIEGIQRWHDKHQATGVMIGVDTVPKIRPIGIPNKDAYQADAQALEPLQQLGMERGLAVVAVGHTRKSVSDDWLDSVIGTTGTTGTADAVLVLKRERGQADAILYGTGRDFGEFEKPLRFDEKSGHWSALDMTAAEAKAGNTQDAIIKLLRQVGCGMMLKQIASGIGRSEQATANALDRMEGNGMARKVGRNLWDLTKW